MLTDDLFDIKERVILVAGAAAGLGRHIAAALGRRGARLDLLDRAWGDHDTRDGDVRRHTVDVTDEAAVSAVVADVIAARGRVDALVNCVGVFHTGPALDLDLARFRQTLDVNLTAAFVLSRAAARAMDPRGGRLLHLASVSSSVSNANYAAYASSKAGLAQLVRVLGREWAPRRITVNAIGPAMTETGLTSTFLAEAHQRDAALSVIPMGRFGTPDDLIGTVLLLVSDAGSFITGQTIYVDGGRTLV